MSLPMQKKVVGRLLRSFSVTARLLTEYRVATMLRQGEYADLAHCVRLAQSGTTAVDGGASVGNYALALRKAVGPDGRVLALEANPEVFRELVRSTWLAGVDARNVAASSQEGTGELRIPVDRLGRVQEPVATLEDRGQECVRVRVPRATLDHLLADAQRVSLIKIDVEGHEGEVIRGARQVLDKHRPALVVEIEAQHVGGPGAMEGVVSLLTNRGYTCNAIHGGTLIPWREFDVERWQSSYLARDKEHRSKHRMDYVNNFLFVHTAQAYPAVDSFRTPAGAGAPMP